MKKSIITLGVLLVLFACKNDIEINKLKYENNSLKGKVDSLENWINNSFDPVIIDDHINKPLHDGDTANFVVGLLMNDERMIDSIELSLYKIQNSNDSQFIRKDILAPKLNNNKTRGVGYFSLPNLSKGKYLYQGFIKYQGKKTRIYRDFSIEP